MVSRARSSSTASSCARGGARAAALGPSTFLLDRVAEDLADRLAAVLRRFELRGRSRHADRCGAARARRQRQGRHHHRRRRAGRRCAAARGSDAHSRSRPTRRRCRSATPRSISSCRRWRCSSSTICPARSIQIRRALKPDGLLLAALAGGDTLTELRQAFAAAEAEIEDGISPRVAPFADLRDSARCCSARASRCR